jgi:hypothetical protein
MSKSPHQNWMKSGSKMFDKRFNVLPDVDEDRNFVSLSL